MSADFTSFKASSIRKTHIFGVFKREAVKLIDFLALKLNTIFIKKNTCSFSYKMQFRTI